MPAQLQFENGGESVALIPTRYPGSEASADGPVALARKTTWEPIRRGRVPRPRPAHLRDRRRRDAAARGARDRVLPDALGAAGRPARRQCLSSARPTTAAARAAGPPDRRRARQEARSCAMQRVISKAQLRQAVLRDLAWLFNCHAARCRHAIWPRLAAACAARSSTTACRRCRARPPRARRRAISSAAIRQAILDFEPRILPATLQVQRARSRPARTPQRHRRRDPRPALGAAGAARVCWSAPRSISRPDRSRSPTSRSRGCRDGSAPAAALQPRAAASARDGRGVRASSSRRSRRGSA